MLGEEEGSASPEDTSAMGLCLRAVTLPPLPNLSGLRNHPAPPARQYQHLRQSLPADWLPASSVGSGEPSRCLLKAGLAKLFLHEPFSIDSACVGSSGGGVVLGVSPPHPGIPL